MVWQSAVVMFLCLFKEHFSVLNHVPVCLKQNSPRRSTVTILFLLKVYFHDHVSKANSVVHNHFSKCIYLCLCSVIFSICFWNRFFGTLFVFQTAGALWLWLKSGFLGCSGFDWQKDVNRSILSMSQNSWTAPLTIQYDKLLYCDVKVGGVHPLTNK